MQPEDLKELRDEVRATYQKDQARFGYLLDQYCQGLAGFYADGGQGCPYEVIGEYCSQKWSPEPQCWYCAGGGDPAPLIQAFQKPLKMEDDLPRKKTQEQEPAPAESIPSAAVVQNGHQPETEWTTGNCLHQYTTPDGLECVMCHKALDSDIPCIHEHTDHTSDGDVYCKDCGIITSRVPRSFEMVEATLCPSGFFLKFGDAKSGIVPFTELKLEPGVQVTVCELAYNGAVVLAQLSNNKTAEYPWDFLKPLIDPDTTCTHEATTTTPEGVTACYHCGLILREAEIPLLPPPAASLSDDLYAFQFEDHVEALPVVIRMSGIGNCRRKVAAKLHQGRRETIRAMLGRDVQQQVGFVTEHGSFRMPVLPDDDIEIMPREPEWDVAASLGSVAEIQVVSWLVQEGFHVEYALQNQAELSRASAKYPWLIWSGHPDGKITRNNKPGLLEVKFLSHGQWVKWQKYGAKVAKPDYFSQSQSYMLVWGLERCLFQVIDRSICQIDMNSCKVTIPKQALLREIVDLDKDYAQSLFDRWEEVAPVIREGGLPGPDRDGRDFECLYCAYRKGCPAWQAVNPA